VGAGAKILLRERGDSAAHERYEIPRPVPSLFALDLWQARFLEGLAVKKVVWCLWLVLAMPSMVSGLERRDGGYYCTVKFAGGIAYNGKEWQGAVFKPSGNFVMKLSFRETIKDLDRDAYDVAITDEGTSEPEYCLVNAAPPRPPSIDKTGVLSCAIHGIQEYKFNFGNHRFIEVYTAGYTNGADNNKDTPSISGGLCTKISQ
jgi:hypothetical protein